MHCTVLLYSVTVNAVHTAHPCPRARSSVHCARKPALSAPSAMGGKSSKRTRAHLTVHGTEVRSAWRVARIPRWTGASELAGPAALVTWTVSPTAADRCRRRTKGCLLGGWQRLTAWEVGLVGLGGDVLAAGKGARGQDGDDDQLERGWCWHPSACLIAGLTDRRSGLVDVRSLRKI